MLLGPSLAQRGVCHKLRAGRNVGSIAIMAAPSEKDWLTENGGAGILCGLSRKHLEASMK